MEMEREKEKVAPTGCFKCGRPGHWSRDCPSSNSNLSLNDETNRVVNLSKKVAQDKPKKLPRIKPKLTPELLLSDDGLGFVLRNFPRAFKYRGRGHEVSDLGNLIGLYGEWHSHLLPYYSFDQFIHKVEQVAASRRVKTCIRDLRERVATGGEPINLHEAPVEHDGQTVEQAPAAAMNSEGQLHELGDPSSNVHAADDIHEDLLHEVYKKVTENDMVGDDALCAGSFGKGSLNQVPKSSNEVDNDITEEQRARMEANRLKALEKAAARACPLQGS